MGSVLWVVIPTVLDGGTASRPGLDRPTIDYVRYGPGQLLRWAASGELLEAGRVPLLTVAAAAGVVVALRRGGPPATRGLVALLVVCFGGMLVPSSVLCSRASPTSISG